MSMSSHISELQKKHTELSDRVESIEKRPASDGYELSMLKKQKLKLKEEISRLSS